MFATMMMVLVGVQVAAAGDPVEEARRAAEQSIRDGERRQLVSKHWQTYATPAFTVVVPSYADAEVAGAQWTLDLAGPYVLSVTTSKQPVATLAKGRLATLGGTQQVADRPGGKVYDVRTAKAHHRVTTRSLGGNTFLVEVRAPLGELDGAIADRIFAGFRK